MIFTLFRKRAVNIEPLKTQGQNHLDCLNRSLKGLSINLRGDVDILLFPLSNVSEVMYPCNSTEYRQKINVKLPCLYSPTLYFADFIFQFFKMVKAKSAII